MSSVGELSLQKTVQLLQLYEGAPLTVDIRESSLRVVPHEDGTFPITVYNHGEDAMVAAERWHTHYDDPMQVAFCVLWLLTPYYRLVHETKGGSLVAAWIERYEETGWEGFEPVYFLNPEHEESWVALPGETITRRYQQQAILPPPKPYREFCPGASLDEDEMPPDFCWGARLETFAEAQGPNLYDGSGYHTEEAT